MARVLAAGLLVVLLCMGSCGQAQELFQESIRAQLEELDLGQLLRFTETLEEGYRELVPSLHWRDLTAGATTSRSVGELLALLLQSFLGELSLSLALLRQLLVIGILAALLQRLSTSFGSKMVVDLAFAVCFSSWSFWGCRVSAWRPALPRRQWIPW